MGFFDDRFMSLWFLCFSIFYDKIDYDDFKINEA